MDKTMLGRLGKTRMDATTWTYLKEMGGAFLIYAIVLPLSIYVLQGHPNAPWRFPLALLPVIPVGLVLLALVRGIGRMDELGRQIQLEALAFSFVGTALMTFGYGFLEQAGLPHVNAMFVLPLMFALWGVGLALAVRKYNWTADRL